MAKWISQFVVKGVTSNQTMNCALATRVDIWCSVTSNYNPVLTLTNLEAGIPIWIWLENDDQATHTFQISATTTAGLSYTISGVSGVGAPIAIGQTGIQLKSGYAVVLIGDPIMQGSLAILSLAVSAPAAVPSGGGSGVSTDANNKATLGSDSLILVQGVSSGASATTHAQTVSGDDPQLVNARTPLAHHATHNLGGSDVIAPDWTLVANKPTAFAPSAHAPTHLSGGSDAIALVTTSAAGLCVPPDGTTISITSGKLVATTTGGTGPVVFLSSATNLVAADSGKYAICSGGSWILGLPTPASGLNYRVRNDMGLSGTTGTITITPSSGTIDGASSILLLAGQEAQVITDGTNWRTFGRGRRVVIGTQDLSSSAGGTILIPPDYRFFNFSFGNLETATLGTAIAAQVSIDGGVTWYTTANYYTQYVYGVGTTTAQTVLSGQAYFYVAVNQFNTGQYPGNSFLSFFPGDATHNPTMIGSSGGVTSASANVIWNLYGFLILASPLGRINALKYFAASGNIASSMLTVEGIV